MKDEFHYFKIEFNRFKQIINNSNSLPEQLKEDLSKIIVNGNNRTKNLLRYIFLWDTEAFRKNQLDDKSKTGITSASPKESFAIGIPSEGHPTTPAKSRLAVFVRRFYNFWRVVFVILPAYRQVGSKYSF